MKRKILYIFIITAVCLGLSGAVIAAGPDVTSMAESIAGKSGYDTASVNDTTLSVTIGSIIRSILGMIGVIFLVLTVYAGFLWMTAGGNDETVGKAKKILISATIGLVIVAAAYGITALVMNIVLNTAAPKSDYTGGSEYSVDLHKGCCWLEGTNQCWNFATGDQCTGRWFSGESCNTLDLPGDATCVVQN